MNTQPRQNDNHRFDLAIRNTAFMLVVIEWLLLLTCWMMNLPVGHWLKSKCCELNAVSVVLTSNCDIMMPFTFLFIHIDSSIDLTVMASNPLSMRDMRAR
jgi:hypothetical protein